MKFNFDRQLVIEGHLQAIIKNLEAKCNSLSNSNRSYKGWKTKRMLKNVK
jgi:hypothetical protein